MFEHLVLTRPLAIFDLETTGTSPERDRIVEISVVKALPGGDVETKTRRVNPGMPIPKAATAVHKISDADVAGEPHFRQLAKGLLEFLDGCDLCGFNIRRFDLPFLNAEFRRSGLEFSVQGRAVRGTYVAGVEPGLVISSGQHANETSGPIGALRAAQQLRQRREHCSSLPSRLAHRG